MRNLLAAAVCVLALGAARAQDETVQEIEPDLQISLAVGQSKTFRLPAFSEIHVSNEGIIKASPHSDRVLSIAGLAQGGAAIAVYGPNNKTVMNAYVEVTPDHGALVKIYGQDTKDPEGRNQAYSAYYCTETTCSRPNKDLPPDPPGSVTQTITKPLPGGGAISTTRQR